jgi:hypothetical protein
MARPVDYRKKHGSKGVHSEDEQVPLGKKDQGRQPHLLDPERPASSAGARPVGQGKHAAGHGGQMGGRKKSK